MEFGNAPAVDPVRRPPAVYSLRSVKTDVLGQHCDSEKIDVLPAIDAAPAVLDATTLAHAPVPVRWPACSHGVLILPLLLSFPLAVCLDADALNVNSSTPPSRNLPALNARIYLP
jgi:hypothetical protein